MFYCKAKNKQKPCISSLSAPLGPELQRLLTGQVWAGTRGPHSTTAEALKLYDDSLHLKLALW